MKNEMIDHPNECVKKLGDLIADVKVAMLTTLDEQGQLHSRPMQSLESGFDGALWFFTSRTSGKVLSIAHDDRVNLAYSDAKTSKFVSVAGKDAISVRSYVYLALSYDHRVIDGADAARFLSAVKARLEAAQFEADLGI